MKHVPIAELAAFINPASVSQVLALLRVSIDASTDQPPTVTAVGGYIAPCVVWTAVESEWRKELDYWRLSKFHLSGLFRECREPDLCERAFTNIIRDSALEAVGSVLVHDSRYNRQEVSHYRYALELALRAVEVHANENYPGEDIAVMFCPDGPEDVIESTFKEQQSRCQRFLSFTIGNSARFLPLQCADLGIGVVRRQWSRFLPRRASREEALWSKMPRGNGKRSTIISQCL